MAKQHNGAIADLFAEPVKPHEFSEARSVIIKSPHEGDYSYSEQWRHECEVRELVRLLRRDRRGFSEHINLIAMRRGYHIAVALRDAALSYRPQDYT